MAVFGLGWLVLPGISIWLLASLAIGGAWLGQDVGHHLQRYRRGLGPGRRQLLHLLLTGLGYGAWLFPVVGIVSKLGPAGADLLGHEWLMTVGSLWALVAVMTQVEYALRVGQGVPAGRWRFFPANSSPSYAEKLPDSP